jgi:hypothetical protein
MIPFPKLNPLRMIKNLPGDLSRKIFKEYIYSQVIHELCQYHHSKQFNPVLKNLIEECFNRCPGSLDEYLVSNDGVFMRPEPGWFDNNHRYFIRMEPEDASRLQAYDPNFFFEILPTPGTQQLLDDVRRRGIFKLPPRGKHPMYESFVGFKKYYIVYVTIRERLTDKQWVNQICTFEKRDSNWVCQNEEYKYIRLPANCFKYFI